MRSVRIVGDDMKLDRNGINANLMSIKLYETGNTALVLLFQLSKMRGLCRESYIRKNWQML